MGKETPKMLNREDIARLMSQETGISKAEIEDLLKLEDEIIVKAVSQGYSIKRHKLFKLSLHKKPPKKAWDGLNKRHFEQKEKYIVKYVQLSAMDTAIDTYNETIYSKEENV